jgi:predicted dehydrogenase
MERLRVGLVGCGMISSAHLKAWQRAEACAVQGVFDLNRELAEKRSREFNIGKIYDTLEALIAECDIVDICTPPQTHAAIAQQAIAGGRHLVVEKPLVTDVADWDKIVALLAGSSLTITMIHNLKFSRSVRQAKQWVNEGRIGQVIRIQRDFLTSPEADRMLVDKHWSHQLPGGRWFETLPHELYLTHYFVGALDVANVIAVQTDHAPSGAPADEVVITLKGDECLATVNFSGNCRQNRRAFTVQGTDGIISVDLLADFASLSTYKDRRWKRSLGGFAAAETSRDVLRWLPNRAGYVWRQIQGQTPHTVIIAAVDRYLQGKGETPTPIEEIDYVVRNCERIGREIDRQLLHA